MSIEPESDIKSQLNKHINSKLFKRFWDKESVKPNNLRSEKSLKIPQYGSPFRSRRSLDYSSEGESEVNHRVNKSISQRSKDQTYSSRQASPYKNPFTAQDEYNDIDLYNNRVSWKDTEESLKPGSFYKVLSPDIIKAYEETQDRLKNELISVKDKYEGIIQKKNAEIKKLQKSQDLLKKQVSDLKAFKTETEENEKNVREHKSNNEIYQRKLAQVEAESDGFKRQLEYMRETCETYRVQIEEYERSSRNKTQDIERELRGYKERCEGLDRQFEREKQKNSELERKFSKSKDRVFALENNLSRAEDRNKRLEKEVQDSKDRISHESTQQLRETEFLRRKIEDLTQEILKSSRNSYTPVQRFEYPEENPFSKSYNRTYREEEPEFRPKPRERERERDRERERERERRDYGEKKYEPDNWQMKEILSPKNRPQESTQTLESKLMSMQLEKKRLEDDLAKIPPHGRRLAQIKRQQEIEVELEILNTSISALKTKLRHYNIF